MDSKSSSSQKLAAQQRMGESLLSEHPRMKIEMSRAAPHVPEEGD